MKKLIFPLIFVSFSSFAANEVEILTDAELKNKMISTVKEIQVQDTIGKSNEVQQCKDQHKFSATNNEQKVVEAVAECFKKKLENQKDPEALKKLADGLGLQSYGLVGSKDKKEIVSYLSGNLYKSLTGVDPNEKNLKKLMEDMKFKNKKHVDQKVFAQLYNTQLIKNAMYEVSRYCFENFRLLSRENVQDSFQAHWEGELANIKEDANYTAYTDTGSKGFGNNLDTSSKDAIYKTLLGDLGANNPETVKTLSNFFLACAYKINPLCEVYENKSDKEHPQRGANSCLAKAKLQNAKKAMAATKELLKDFDSLNVNTLQIQLDQSNYSFYDYGKKDSTNSLDSLTNYTSQDILNAKVVDDEKLKNCKDNGSGADCEGLIVIDDSLQVVTQEMDLNLRLKKEAELARIKQLQETNKQDLEKYLEQNGYFDLLADFKNNKDMDFEPGLNKIFDARREAALADLKKKVGPRQVSQADIDSGKVDKKKQIQENAQELAEERVRLAQVIMFNNIITSGLTLHKEGKDGKVGEKAGSNIGALTKETKALEGASVESQYFENLKTSMDGKSGNTENNSLQDLQFLDSILGKRD